MRDASASSDESTRGNADPVAQRLIAVLRAEGAAERGHAGGRSLLDHLVGTYEIAGRWQQPADIQHAALIHSVYGTDAYRQALFPLSRRAELRELAGSRAERLAHLFSTTPRATLLAGTHRWARELDLPADAVEPADADELDALVLLHMANLADQASAEDGRPGGWLVRIRDLAELLAHSDAVSLPLFVAELASLTEAEESLCRDAYRAALTAEDAAVAAGQFALAAATCPVVPEPCVWLAYLAGVGQDGELARHWARTARRRLIALGTPWDKRLSFAEWLELMQACEHLSASDAPGWTAATGEPRALLDALRAKPGGTLRSPEPDSVTPHASVRRFRRYLERLSEGEADAIRGHYPDLPSRPWYDADSLPLPVALQSQFEAIRTELGAIGRSAFHRESERIPRSGDWDVAFLYERGRRHDDICAACPVTARTVEAHGAMLTAAGLVYVSRMRAGTHIQPHRGPTNLRLRCHLGVEVPAGDCAIRVADEVRRWDEGQCLVFDDYFEHEAWNHTDDDRVVLIVDLWHPELSRAEIRWLTGLHRYTHANARRLSRYWSANAAAAQSAAS